MPLENSVALFNNFSSVSWKAGFISVKTPSYCFLIAFIKNIDVRQAYINEWIYRFCLAVSITKNRHSLTFITMLSYKIIKLAGFISTNLKLLCHNAHFYYTIAMCFLFSAPRTAIGQLHLKCWVIIIHSIY